MTTDRLLARNSVLNLFGHAAPLVVALLTIPPLLRGFGTERFGVLLLVQAAIGYFSLFELGLGRALTQSVAQRLSNGNSHELPVVARAGLSMLLVLGIAAGLSVAALTPLLASTVLKVPVALQSETAISFWILSAALPFVLGTTGLRGLIEAHQHFGIATVLRLPSVVFTFVGPLLVLPFSNSLVPAVSVIALGRVVTFAAHLIVSIRMYPYLTEQAPIHRAPMASLLRFGAWMTVSNIVSPMMVYLDRFLIGAGLSLAAVTAYVTPYEVIVKMLVIPAALTGAAMPAFAAAVAAQPKRMADLWDKSFRAVMIVMFPIVLVGVVLAREGLELWVGSALPAESAIVLQWLALGVFATAVAFTPSTALHSAGRPDLIAKLHLIELPLYAAGIIVLMRALGIQGIAIAWTVRAILDAAAILWIAHRTLRVPVVPQLGGFWSMGFMLAAMAAGAALTTTPTRVAYAAAIIAAFVPLAWLRLLTPSERRGLREWLGPAPAPTVSPSIDA
jgi:O-antigen/teichoic acid export membrane protein